MRIEREFFYSLLSSTASKAENCAARSDGGSNAKLANILEYGKHGQPAKPFLKPAKTASRQECIDAMTKALDEEVEKL